MWVYVRFCKCGIFPEIGRRSLHRCRVVMPRLRPVCGLLRTFAVDCAEGAVWGQTDDFMNMRKRIEVVAAVIRDGNRILATQRGYGPFKDMWEFPGGKMESGETEEIALVREIKEEMGAMVSVDRHIKTVEYDYPDFHLVLHCYLCRVVSGDLILKEHEAAKWLDVSMLGDVDWLPADLLLLDDLASLLSAETAE